MPKQIAIARARSPRLRVAFWLLLAVLLTLGILAQAGHAITTGALGSDKGYVLVSADEQSDGDCSSHGEASSGVHCGSASGGVVAIASAPATSSPLSAGTARAIPSDAAEPGRLPSPFFHPPKLIVQA